MYTLGTFIIMLSSYFLVRALDNKKYWLWYGLATAAALYTHYYLLFSVAAQGLFVILYLLRSRRFDVLWRAGGAYTLAAALYLPWIPTLLQQISRVEANYWIPAMDRWSVPGTVWKMAFGGEGARNLVYAAASVVALIIIIYYFRKVVNFNKWLVLSGAIVPFVCAIAVSLKTNLYLDRYFVFASLFFTILIAHALWQIPKAARRWGLIILLSAATLFAFFKNWQKLAIADKPGMAGAAEYINGYAAAGDRIYVGSSFVYFTFKYYNQTGIAPLLYSTEPLKNIPHFSGTALLNGSDLILDFDKTPKKGIVWLLWTTGFGGSKPGVPANWKQQEERGYQDAPGFKGWIIVTKYKVN